MYIKIEEKINNLKKILALGVIGKRVQGVIFLYLLAIKVISDKQELGGVHIKQVCYKDHFPV